MFDVIWTDHNRESVGERRARKESERGKEAKHTKDCEVSARSSSIDTRDSTSSDDKTFGFLGSIRFRKRGSSSKSKTTASSGLRAPRTASEETRDSLVPSSITSSDGKPSSMSPMDGSYLLSHMSDPWENSPDPSSQESVFTKWTKPSVPSSASMVGGSPTDTISTPKPRAELSQTIGRDSFITETKHASIECRKESDPDFSVSSVSITAASKEPRTPSPPLPQMLTLSKTEEWVSALRDLSTTPSSSKTSTVTELRSPFLSPIPESSTAPSIPLRDARRVKPSSHGPARFEPNNMQLWKAPVAWNSSPTPAPPGLSGLRQNVMDQTMAGERNEMSLDLADMQREIKRMVLSSPRSILLRLKEEWAFSGDARLYKELETEKKRWMLSALHNMDGPSDSEAAHRGWIMSMARDRILALYETHATASYLAALHPNGSICHLSPTPLSPVLFTNIAPIFTPVVSSSAMAFGPELFNSAYCSLLPSLVPSTDIPLMLRNINRYLTPQGALYLTVIDPSPIATTLGPRLRAWLSENLLLNLERQFRCTNPSKLLPDWLLEANLRGLGSTITRTTFDVFPSECAEQDSARDSAKGAKDNDDEDRRVRVELRSTVGRMLWQDVWGTFITASKWFWEVPEIAEECRQLGTKWEYSFIHAVKQS